MWERTERTDPPEGWPGFVTMNATMNQTVQTWMPAILALFGSLMVVVITAWLNTKALSAQIDALAETTTPPMYLGGSLDFPKELAAKLNKALESMKADGSYDKIVKSYK